LLEYPSKLLNTTLQCTFASVQSFVIAIVMERDLARWKLAGGMSLVAVLFTVSILSHCPRRDFLRFLGLPAATQKPLCLRCVLEFQGIVVAAISYYLQIWVIEKKGPVFLSMSMPLSLVFTMVIASFLLGEDVSLGR
jgi:drug/metabolite transporter (DMT)-like permease